MAEMFLYFSRDYKIPEGRVAGERVNIAVQTIAIYAGLKTMLRVPTSNGLIM